MGRWADCAKRLLITRQEIRDVNHLCGGGRFGENGRESSRGARFAGLWLAREQPIKDAVLVISFRVGCGSHLLAFHVVQTTLQILRQIILAGESGAAD